MSTLQFDDGWTPDLSGDYRIVNGPDGLYVVGRGVLSPVDNYEDGEALINDLRNGDRRDATLGQGFLGM